MAPRTQCYERRRHTYLRPAASPSPDLTPCRTPARAEGRERAAGIGEERRGGRTRRAFRPRARGAAERGRGWEEGRDPGASSAGKERAVPVRAGTGMRGKEDWTRESRTGILCRICCYGTEAIRCIEENLHC
uniref:Uncharacterized protein n=1 Tax=Oryza brachyantha TaxID=4533 RepID=J3L258_ORYBR